MRYARACSQPRVIPHAHCIAWHPCRKRWASSSGDPATGRTTSGASSTQAACACSLHPNHTVAHGFFHRCSGLNYHISALYVVDLVRFRQLAAGDQLRAIYDQLSRDPNSLSNLDQDLPNYAQHMIPIHSLPIEWLWCESWCSDESKPAAKTIDLCNNPLHKEPKLDMARRVISGDLFEESWVELDATVRECEEEIAAAIADGATVQPSASTRAALAAQDASGDEL